MAQEVHLMGATYSDVPSVLIPDSNNTFHSFVDTSDATATASEILSGYTAYSNGTKVTGTASSGASNIVTGTFKGTTSGAAMDVDIPYTGSGYPIAVLIYPSINDAAAFDSTIHKGSIALYCSVKKSQELVPSYTRGNNDYSKVLYRYKSSTSNATTTGDSSGITTQNYNDYDATAARLTFMLIRSATKLSVYIPETSVGNGFMPNIEYTYHVIYSE